jgi:hypothetical protein
MVEIPNLENLTKALLESKISYHTFLSGGRLRVLMIRDEQGNYFKDEEKVLRIYGEAPKLLEALQHADENVLDGLDYKGQYSGDNAKYPHYLTGAYCDTEDYLDRLIWKGNIDIYAVKGGEDIKVKAVYTGGTYEEILDKINFCGYGKNIKEALEELYKIVNPNNMIFYDMVQKYIDRFNKN